MYLHSNMFLLFPVLHTTGGILLIIYIPICFYYFLRSACRASAYNAIYIPICFYYFCNNNQFMKNLAKFTFQYVSIISWIFSSFQDFYAQFTFQYVSIISTYFPKIRTGYKNLHSNMFLLFPHERV